MVDNYTHIFFTLSHGNKVFQLKLPMKKRVSILREEGYNLFYPLQGKIVLLYRGRDIAPFDDMTIGYFFKGISRVNIIVQDKAMSVIDTIDKDFINKSHIRSQSQGVNQTMVIESRMKLTSENKTEDIKMNCSQDLIQREREQHENSQINMTSLIHQDPNTSLTSMFNQRMICFDCKKSFIYFFCRQCNNFICKPCKERMQLAHFNHEVVRVLAEDIPKAVNTYLTTLSNELKKSKKEYDVFDKQFTTIRDLDKWELEIKGKIDLIEELAQDIIIDAKQPNYDIEREVRDIRDSMSTIIENSSPSSIDLFDKLNQVDKYVGTVLKKATDFVMIQNKKKKIDQMVQPINAELDHIIKQLQIEP